MARRMVEWICGVIVLWSLVGCATTRVADAAVLVLNESRPTRCAEEDNVYVKLQGEGLRRFRAEARHPPYMAQVRVDSYAPDFSNCNFDENRAPADPKYTFTPKRVILWETDKYLLVGNTHESFWRPNKVDFVVGEQVTPEVHLVQMYVKDKEEPKLGRHQFLVLYPPDGYWRAKPLPTLPLNYSVYGTSFLAGPVEEAGRPVVNITKVEFVPAELTFKLTYLDGSHGEMRVAEIDRARLVLEYVHDRALPAAQPLAAIRSMYVTPENADTAEVTWRAPGAPERQTRALPAFSRAEAVEVQFGRTTISKHNSSAPDMWFGAFRR